MTPPKLIDRSFLGSHKSSNLDSIASGFQQRDLGVSIARKRGEELSSPTLADRYGKTGLVHVRVEGKGLDYAKPAHRDFIDKLWNETPGDVPVIARLRKMGVEWVNNWNGIGRADELHVLNPRAVSIMKRHHTGMRAENKGERGSVTLDIQEIRKMEQAAIAKLKHLAEGGAKVLARTETLKKRYDQTGTLRVNQHGGVEALKRIPIQDIRLMPGNHLYPDKVKEYQGRPDAPNPELRITPDGKFVVYDGNHRVEAARNRGDKDVLAWVSKLEANSGYPSSEPVKYTYASTQVNLPKALADKVLRANKGLISDRDLAPDGREMEPHVTIRFGLHGEDPAVIQRLLENEPPIRVKLGKVSTFPDSGDGEVVKVDVDSPDLHRLNKRIADALPSTSTHAGYKPHLTLAYTKPGTGKKYVGSSILEGEEVTIPTITFSDRSGRHHTIRLEGRP